MSTQAAVLEWTPITPEEPENWIEDEAPPSQSNHHFDALEMEIESAQRISDLKDDWDGEGSPGYVKSTLDRAIVFLRMQAEWLWERCNIDPPSPRINPGPAGSIDLYWKQPSWELLINVPQDETRPASFYGDDFGTHAIKGSMDITKPNLGLLIWLMK